MACAFENETNSSSSQSSKTDWTLLEEFTSREVLKEYLKNLEFHSATYQTNHRMQCTICTVKHEIV